ncbi:MAG: caspase family protein [Pseudomonadota bacterium]
MRTRRPFLTALGLTASILASVGALSTPAEAGQRALLIGIGAYQNIRPLIGPPRDLVRMERFLTEHMGYRSDEIAVLKDGQATRKNLLRTMENWLVRSTKAGDKVFIYYSGHGSQLPDKNDDEKDGLDETLSPIDTTKDGRNQITDDEFGAILAKMSNRDLTVIIDSCHSGTISRGAVQESADTSEDQARTFIPDLSTRSGGPTPDQVDAHRGEASFLKSADKLRIWSAASANQFSWDTLDGGIFTRNFINGVSKKLADKNKNGTVTHAELIAYLRSEASAYCRTNPRCSQLGFTPTLETHPSALARAIVPVAAEPQETTETKPEQATDAKPEAAVDAAAEAAEVLVQSNDADVKIEINPGRTLKLGQEFRISVTAKKPGELILLDVNSNGEVTQLIPNDIMLQNGRDREIVPGRRITIPDDYYGFAFAAGKPLGRGKLLAIVTEDDVKVDQLLAANRAIAVVPNSDEFLGDLASTLLKVHRKDKKNRAVRWSLGALEYEIVE